MLTISISPANKCVKSYFVFSEPKKFVKKNSYLQAGFVLFIRIALALNYKKINKSYRKH